MDGGIVIALLAGLTTFAIPIVGALWKVFSIREQLQIAIAENRHRLELLEQQGNQPVTHRLELLEQKADHLVDQQKLALNGVQEAVQHVRLRSQTAESKLDQRLREIELFLTKTTAFEQRQHD